MTENNKAILRIVGELLKEERETHNKTIKTMAELHDAAIEELKADFKTQISEIELKHGVDGKDGVDFKGFTDEELESFKGSDGKDATIEDINIAVSKQIDIIENKKEKIRKEGIDELTAFLDIKEG